jgi:23S rRNA (uracil1939-C5)-methyltransferase
MPGAPFTIRQRGWSFSQPAFEANLLLVKTVIEALGEPVPKRVLELYAGSGNFTLPLAALGVRVFAVEGDRQAARDLSENLTRAQQQAQVVAAPVKLALQRISDLDAVLLDPPRIGAADIMPALAGLAPPRIVYVSCDPATLARDLRHLSERGYRVDDVKTLDLFPQTFHVECVVTCLLEER